MSLLAQFLLPKRRDDEDDNERLIEDAIDRTLIGKGTLDLADQAFEYGRKSYFPTQGEKISDAKSRLELVDLSRRLGLNPKQAMDSDILNVDDEKKPNYLGFGNLAGRSLSSISDIFAAKKAGGPSKTILDAMKVLRKR